MRVVKQHFIPCKKVVKEENSSEVNSNALNRGKYFVVLIRCNKFYNKKQESTKTESITTR